MWTAHAGHGSRAQPRMGKSNSVGVASFVPSSPDASSQPAPSQPHHQYTVSALEAENFADFFEPAIDGPPSPRRIRALNNRVKQASLSERHVSQQTTASATSLLSLASVDRRPSWEQALDSISLSRKSSVRSTTSSMPSKDRPESVQAIGKAIFNRKAKFRRESLATSGGSTFPNDMAAEVPNDRTRAASVSREHLMTAMNIFHRRRTVQSGDDSSSQRKPLISSPFNFQHVHQIQRDQLPNLEHVNRAALQSEFSGRRAPPVPPTVGIVQGAAEDLRAPDFSSKTTRPRDEDEPVPPHVVPHDHGNGTASRRPSYQKALPPPPIKHTRSQDHITSVAPPRPPRSPTELDMDYFDFVPPMVPPRNSSRPSIPRRDSEALGNMTSDRHQGMAGFRSPGPTTPKDTSSPPSTSSGAPSPSFVEDRRYSRIFLPTETPNWPLTCPLSNSSATTFEAALPDVPEEEEQQHGLPRRSRASVRSTNSSLRGSLSVPALRKLSVSSSHYSSHDRTFSRDSVVLGAFDLSAPAGPGRDTSSPDFFDEPLRRDSWEDVIDYCYEHELEADDDYDWRRPSYELEQEPRVLVAESEDEMTLPSRPVSDRIEVPALSPCDLFSPGSTPEAVTPTIPAPISKSPTRANFSLPRRERPQRLLHVRQGSTASFKESQGFTLSPSFLIPTEYHHELLAARSEQYQDPESIAHAVTYEEPTLTLEASSLFVPARSSASTTASASNLSSRSVFERHISSTSTNTDYTRLTTSTGSVDGLDNFIFKDDSPQAAAAAAAASPEDGFGAPDTPAHARSHSAADLLHRGASPTLSRDQHSSDSNLIGLRSPKKPAGRARSKTMSSSPGQFSLFPAVNSSKSPRI